MPVGLIDTSDMRGAAPDRMSFYSTSSRIVQADWLPILQSRFSLHLNAEKDQKPGRLPSLPKYKKESGFSKNTSSFVPYDKTVDDSDKIYSEEAFVTCHSHWFQHPSKPSANVFSTQKVGAKQILDSGFTKVPACLPAKNELPVLSEMKNRFDWNHVLKSGRFDRAAIAPSGSAFESDVTHIKSFGAAQESPFAAPVSVPLSSRATGNPYPKLMKADGYTRSEGSMTIPSIQLSNKPLPKMQPEAVRMVCGPKQDTGSIKNNVAYMETKDSCPSQRFATETMERLGSLDVLSDPAEQRTTNSTEIRKAAVKRIADEFLAVDELSIESRSYLVKTTLPSVVVALEQLIQEMKTHDIPLNGRVEVLKSLDQTRKEPPVRKFDSINWLAQKLMRNGDSTACSTHGTLYLERVAQVATELEGRIKEIAADKERKKIAAEISLMLEKERLVKERKARLLEKRAQFTEYLDLSFNLWMESLWRKNPGDLYRTEIVAEMERLLANPEVQSDAELFSKIQAIHMIIANPESDLPEANESNLFFDIGEPLYHLDCATVNRWNSEFYTKIFIRLMINWTVPDLTNYIRILASSVAAGAGEMNEVFSATIFTPKFTRIAVVRDWLQQLAQLVQVVDFDSPFRDATKKAFQAFCAGREDPRFVFQPKDSSSDEIIEHENPAIGFAETSYRRFCKCIIGEFGSESFRLLMQALSKEYHLSTPEFPADAPAVANPQSSETADAPAATEAAGANADSADGFRRSVAENLALEALHSLHGSLNLNLQRTGQECLGILGRAFEAIYEKKRLFGRISLQQTAVARLVEGKTILKNDEGISANGVIESGLKVLAASQHVKSSVIGHAVDSNAIDSQVLEKGQGIRSEIYNESPSATVDPFLVSMSIEKGKTQSLISVPLRGQKGGRFGVASLLIHNQTFGNDDLVFLEKAASTIAAILEGVDKKERSISLVLNAIEFIRFRLHTEMEMYTMHQAIAYSVGDAGALVRETDEKR
ncbi:hypothetical protein HDU91_004937 [Kappamyces sp. JEL0680]|nr:hypothetical protein HDU91_004937 [Kappamyces sp. JEL0680]